jgi:hypothetical protein
MIHVYLNYPTSNATIHQTGDCPRISQHHSPNERKFRINPQTIQSVLGSFINGEVPFKAEAGCNDAWLEIDFNDLEFEIALAKFILRQLGKRYAPFDSLTPELHC